MRFLLLFLSIFTINMNIWAKYVPPINDELDNAINISNTSAFCTTDAAYTNMDATTTITYGKPLSWTTVGKDVWFKFTASKYDVNISVSGQVNAASSNTLLSPLVALYTFEPNAAGISELIGTAFTTNNVTSFYKGALAIGQVYYIRVSANNDGAGSFKLCVDNYFPPIQPGQDCGSVSVLCSKETFTQLNVTGTGNNNEESAGTCLGRESNSAWYMFKASKGGDFTFIITPSVVTNDIDWVFYDLGINGDCSMVNASTAIRCAAGSGVTCTPGYYKTGLSMTETDLTESSGCPPISQNGLVKYVDLVEGHTYALLIDNFSSGNNGFTIEFDGTADLAGPTAAIQVEKLNPCTDNQAYIFNSNATNYAELKWSFGEGASIPSANTNGPFTVTYTTPGEKVIVLEAKAANGCSVVTTQTFIVAKTPDKPVIMASDLTLCQGERLQFSTPFINLASYHWAGPNGFTSSQQNPSIVNVGPEHAGVYKLFVQVGDCVSEENSIEIQSVDLKPEASFSIVVNNKCEANQSFSIVNESKNYTKITWAFGDDLKLAVNTENDGKTVTYQTPGLKTILLTIETNNGCTATYTENILVELKPETPEITINQPAFCLQDVLKLAVPAQDNMTYTWTGPNNFTANTNAVEIPITDFNQAGTYKVLLTLGNCTSDPATVVIPPIARIPVAGFNTDPKFNVKFSAPAPVSFTNTSLYSDSYEWQFGDGGTSSDVNPVHTFLTEGIFKITLTAFSNNGCSNAVTQGDLIIKKESSLFTPKAFSPNGDGVNDEFVVGITNLKRYQLQIYNRFGSQLFSSENIFNNWNGKFKGNDVAVGVYYYVILGTTLNNENVKYSGSVTVIR